MSQEHKYRNMVLGNFDHLFNFPKKDWVHRNVATNMPPELLPGYQDDSKGDSY